MNKRKFNLFHLVAGIHIVIWVRILIPGYYSLLARLVFLLFCQESIKGVERNINEMLQYQHHTRGRETWDYNLLEDNNRYVQNWSIAQILVITCTTVLQVYFVRKLFEIKNARPRA